MRTLRATLRGAAILGTLGLLATLALPGAAQERLPAGEEVLTHGPVHEAFGEPVTFDPEPGIVVGTKPPDVIEELPPDQRPEGDDVVWIPGYWAWDDDRGDY